MTIQDERLVKAARELLRWDQQKLAERANLSLITIRRYETATSKVTAATLDAIEAALIKAGIAFVPPGTLGDLVVAGGVVLRNTARPDPKPDKRTYTYRSDRKGRPRMTPGPDSNDA